MAFTITKDKTFTHLSTGQSIRVPVVGDLFPASGTGKLVAIKNPDQTLTLNISNANVWDPVGSGITNPQNLQETLTEGDNAMGQNILNLQRLQFNAGIRIGTGAGVGVQAPSGIAIGNDASVLSQGVNSISIGEQAGRTQAQNAIAIGNEAGGNQNQNAIAIGNNSGFNNQQTHTIAIGSLSGSNGQAQNSIAIGYGAGNNQQTNAVSIGYNTIQASQGDFAIAIGHNAGGSNQGMSSICIGRGSGGIVTTAQNTIIIGQGTSVDYLQGAIRIGSQTAFATLQTGSLCIGLGLFNTVASNSVILCPQSDVSVQNTNNSTIITCIRSLPLADATHILYWNSDTCEIIGVELD